MTLHRLKRAARLGLILSACAVAIPGIPAARAQHYVASQTSVTLTPDVAHLDGFSQYDGALISTSALDRVNFQGFAEADIAQGAVRARVAKAEGLRGGATAMFNDTIRFDLADGQDSAVIPVRWTIEGLVGAAGPQYAVSAYFTLVDKDTSQGVRFEELASGGTSGYFRENGSHSETFSGFLTVTESKIYRLEQLIQLNMISNGSLDFSHTAYVNLDLPDGVTMTSSSGALLTDPIVRAVPEPAAWAMMITGFGLVGGSMRRRQAPRVAMVRKPG